MLDDHEARFGLLRTDSAKITDDPASFTEGVLVGGALDPARLRKAMKQGKDFLREHSGSNPSSSAISPRIAGLVRAATQAQRFELTRVGDRDALRIEHADGSRELRLLTPEERSLLGPLLKGTTQ